MQLTVNNQSYEVPDAPDRPLLWVLRDELGLTGTKFSCQIGVCATCTVHIDGVVAKSCQMMISKLAGRKVTTIEGLAQPGADGPTELHPVQQAFLDEQVPQCGWCQPAQIMTAAALLASNPSPSAEEIRTAMDAVYCRCGTYARVRKAVARAAGLGELEGQA